MFSACKPLYVKTFYHHWTVSHSGERYRTFKSIVWATWLSGRINLESASHDIRRFDLDPEEFTHLPAVRRGTRKRAAREMFTAATDTPVISQAPKPKSRKVAQRQPPLSPLAAPVYRPDNWNQTRLPDYNKYVYPSEVLSGCFTRNTRLESYHRY